MWQRNANPWLQIEGELYNTGQIVKIVTKERALYFSDGEKLTLEKYNFDNLLNTLFEHATLTYNNGHTETF